MTDTKNDPGLDLDFDDLDELDRNSAKPQDERHGSGISLWMVLGILLTAGAILYIVLDGADDAVYAYTVDQAVEQVEDLEGKQFRVRGLVKEGSIDHKPGTLLTRFDLVHNGKTITISFDEPLPDTFKEGLEVLAQGKLTADGVLDADEVIAKCPSKYEEQAPTMGGAAEHPADIPIPSKGGGKAGY